MARVRAFALLAAGFCPLIPAAVRAEATGSKPLAFTGTIVSTHDRLPPYEVKGIVVERKYRIAFASATDIEEHWSSMVLRTANAPNVNLPNPDSDSRHSLGEDGAKVVWHVVNPHTLRRISQGQQFIVVMTFSFDDKNKTCKLDAKFAQQQGFDYVVMRRTDNGTMANFTLDKVTDTTCEVK